MSFVCKGESISYGKAALKYAELRTLKELDARTGKYDKDTGILIARELSRKHLFEGLSPDECITQMTSWKEITGHGNIVRDFLWLSINPSPEACEMLEDGGIDVNGEKKKWEDMCDDFLRKMNLDNTMAIAITHDRTDKKASGRKHVHILASRIDMDGKVISDKQIGLRAKKVAEEMSVAYGMVMAKDLKSDRKKIRSIACEELARLQEYSQQAFRAALERRGVHMEAYADRQGNVRGYRLYVDGGHKYKLSQIDRGLTATRIQSTWRQLHGQWLKIQTAKARQQGQDNDARKENRVGYRNNGRQYGSPLRQTTRHKDGASSRQNTENLQGRQDGINQNNYPDNDPQHGGVGRLTRQRTPDTMVREAGIESIIVRKEYSGDCKIKAVLKDGRYTDFVKISNKDFYECEEGKVSRSQLALKYLFRADSQGRGDNREWEVGLHGGYEAGIERSRHLSM